VTAERQPGVPEDMADEALRDRVIQSWRQVQAREVAKKRAEEIAKKVREAMKPIGETLAEETVTGKPGTGYVTVRPTGLFSWYQMPVVPPSPSMQQRAEPELTSIPGLKPLGNEFMDKVLREMKPGTIGIAECFDKSEVYVVQLTSRDPSTPEGWDMMKKMFLAHGVAPEYRTLVEDDRAIYGRNGLDALMKRENVRYADRPEQSDQPEQSEP